MIVIKELVLLRTCYCFVIYKLKICGEVRMSLIEIRTYLI